MIFRSTAYDFTFNVGVATRTWDIYVSKDGGEYTTAEGTIAEITNDGYVFGATDNDMDANIISILVIENNTPLNILGSPIKYEATIVTEDPLTFNGAAYLNNLESILTAIYNKMGGEVWTYTMYTDSTLQYPLVGCTVRMCADYAGNIVISEKITDSNGETKWLVSRGQTYYMFRSKLGYTFTNPDTEIIDSVGSLSISSFAAKDELIMKKTDIVSDTVDWEYKVFTDPLMKCPLEGCIVRVTEDVGGFKVIDEKITDVNGLTTWNIKPGIYYVWREKDRYRFINPDKQIIE